MGNFGTGVVTRQSSDLKRGATAAGTCLGRILLLAIQSSLDLT